jgi:phage terminase large subunit-like protein
MKTQILAARKDPAAFIEFVLRSPKGERIELEWFHKEWLELIHSERRVQIEAPKSHGKTTILIGFIVWMIGNNPNIRIKLFAQSEDKARERLGVVADLILRNKLVKLVFPSLRPNRKGPWHKSAICVDRDISDKEPTLESSGIMGSVEGGRADLVVLDDICDFRTSLIYPQHREAIKKKIYAEILPMLEEDGRAVSIATPHHELDAVASLRKNREWRSEVYSVGTDADPFVPLWPKRWPREALIKLRNEIGPLEYDRALRCKAISGALAMLKPEHIRYYDAAMLGDPNNLACVQAYDLAISQNRKSSWFACVTVLYNVEKNIAFVADAWHAKLGFAEQAQLLVEESRKWQPNRIVIEETGYQAALRGYLMELAKEPLPIYPMKPGNLSKELRLMEAMPMFEGGRVYFNPRLDPQIYIERTSIGDIVGQLREFPQGTDKDLVDALAYAVKSLRSFQQEGDDEDWESGEGMAARISVF